MLFEKGHEYSPSQCACKWKNIKRNYKVNLSLNAFDEIIGRTSNEKGGFEYKFISENQNQKQQE